ncbi:hypothetical protein JW921_03945, partial [Candidatus Fermentibacterales bacterium]|nr:hypothetical protein [Candidatus Fermentibacterales bacterium]
MKSLRLLGYIGVSVVVISTLTGSFYKSPSEDPVAAAVGIGFLCLAASMAVFFWRRPGSVGALVLLWCAALTLVGVQMSGGFHGPGMIAYPLLLLWMALPSVAGPAAIAGLCVGLCEVLSFLIRSGGGLSGVVSRLLPSLAVLVPLTVFGIVAEWLTERESVLGGARRGLPEGP